MSLVLLRQLPCQANQIRVVLENEDQSLTELLRPSSDISTHLFLNRAFRPRVCNVSQLEPVA